MPLDDESLDRLTLVAMARSSAAVKGDDEMMTALMWAECFAYFRYETAGHVMRQHGMKLLVRKQLSAETEFVWMTCCCSSAGTALGMVKPVALHREAVVREFRDSDESFVGGSNISVLKQLLQLNRVPGYALADCAEEIGAEGQKLIQHLRSHGESPPPVGCWAVETVKRCK